MFYLYRQNLGMPALYSSYKYQRILYYSGKGFKPYTIARVLREENLRASRNGIAKFFKKHKRTGTTRVLPGLGRPSVITSEMKQLVDQQMERDDETTATQLHRMLVEAGHRVSLRTVLRCRRQLGWTFRGSKYCQLVREVNKVKRLEWAKKCLEKKDDFANVIWTDESSIQLETHRRFSFRRQGCQPRLKPRYVI